MRLCLGTRSYGLAARALVVGSVDNERDIAGVVADGADIVEVAGLRTGPEVDVAVCVAPPDDEVLRVSLVAGASVVDVPVDASDAWLRCCAATKAALIVSPSQLAAVHAAGVAADRIVVRDGDVDGLYPVLVDVSMSPWPVAAAAVAVIQGARIVRAGAGDVRAVRRVCDTLAVVMDDQ